MLFWVIYSLGSALLLRNYSGDISNLKLKKYFYEVQNKRRQVQVLLDGWSRENKEADTNSGHEVGSSTLSAAS